MAWVYWEKVTCPLEKRGLGLGALKNMNISLLLKWWWRYKHEKETLWGRTIILIHSHIHSPSYMPIKEAITGTWNDIAKVGKELDKYNKNPAQLMKGVVGNGKEIRFWLDWWVRDRRLKDGFPDFFILERNKKASVEVRKAPWSRLNYAIGFKKWRHWRKQ
ncbi:hypothetical protein Hanom_Chr03g00277841 [Helianthus anomalus]